MESCAFFDGVLNYGQEHFNRYFKNLFKNGISMSEAGVMELPVRAEGNKVIIGEGFSIIQGFSYNNDSDCEHTIVPNANYDRIDRVVIRLNLPEKTVRSAIVTGTAGSNPQPPNLQRGVLIYELSLAQIRIKPNGVITVTDERFNTDLCGALRPKNLAEFEAMIKAYQKRWEEWFAQQQGQGWRNIFIQEEKPENTAEGSIWIHQTGVLT